MPKAVSGAARAAESAPHGFEAVDPCLGDHRSGFKDGSTRPRRRRWICTTCRRDEYEAAAARHRREGAMSVSRGFAREMSWLAGPRRLRRCRRPRDVALGSNFMFWSIPSSGFPVTYRGALPHGTRRFAGGGRELHPRTTITKRRSRILGMGRTARSLRTARSCSSRCASWARPMGRASTSARGTAGFIRLQRRPAGLRLRSSTTVSSRAAPELLAAVALRSRHIAATTGPPIAAASSCDPVAPGDDFGADLHPTGR